MITASAGRRLRAALLAAALIALPAYAQRQPPVLGDPEELRGFWDPLIREKLAREGIPGAAVAVVKDGEILFAGSYGFASLERKSPINADRTIFRIGSVTKLFTATAVMQLVEQGKIRLDDDIGRYLPGFRVSDSFPQPVTIANLLTHTGGFEEQLAGTGARRPEEVLPLERYLSLRMPPRVYPPGDLICYSNQGYTLLGYVVEAVSGLPFEQYVEKNIFQPLQMSHSAFTPPARLEPDLASGYEKRRGQYQEAPWVYLNIAPAAGISATAADIAHFMSAQLGGGSYGGERILVESTVREMQSRHFTNHEGLPGMTWGFFESFYFNRRCLYHTGTIRGYSSLLYLIPDQKVGVFAADNCDREDVVWSLLDDFLKHYYPSEPPLLAVTPEAAARAGHFAGSYQHVKHSKRTIEKMGILRGGQTYVSVNDDGTLDIYGMRFAEVEPLLFRRVDGFERAAFREDRNGRVTHLFLDQDAHEKLAWYETSLCQQLIFCILSLSFLSAFFGWSETGPDWDRARPAGGHTAPIALALARSVSGLNLFFLVGITVVFMSTGTGEAWYRLPRALPLLLSLPFISAVPSLALPVAAVMVWRNGWWSPRRRLQFSIIAIAALCYFPYLNHWNLLGFRY